MHELVGHLVEIAAGQLRMDVLELRKIVGCDQEMNGALVNVLEMPHPFAAAPRLETEPNRRSCLYRRAAGRDRDASATDRNERLAPGRCRCLAPEARAEQVGVGEPAA